MQASSASIECAFWVLTKKNMSIIGYNLIIKKVGNEDKYFSFSGNHS